MTSSQVHGTIDESRAGGAVLMLPMSASGCVPAHVRAQCVCTALHFRGFPGAHETCVCVCARARTRALVRGVRACVRACVTARTL